MSTIDRAITSPIRITTIQTKRLTPSVIAGLVGNII